MEIIIIPIAMGGVVLYVLLSNPKTRNIARNSIMFQSSLKNNGVNENKVFKMLKEAKIGPCFRQSSLINNGVNENDVFKILKEANIGPCFLQIDECDKINMTPESHIVENIDEYLESQPTKFTTKHMLRRIKARK